MKNLHKKIISGALVGAIALGGFLQYGQIISFANSLPSYNHQRNLVRLFIEKDPRLNIIRQANRPIRSINFEEFRDFSDFKKRIDELGPGLYNVLIGRKSNSSSIMFEKK